MSPSPPSTRLREATVDDVETVGALIVGLAEYEQLAHEVVWTIPQLRDALFGPQRSAQVTLATDGADTVVGFALWYPTFSTFLARSGIWLEDLFVVRERRGEGHGLALLRHLRSLTNGRVEWSVLDWNEPSIEFYEALGARPVDGWTRYRWLAEDSGIETRLGSSGS
jgi:GNAT superfamily N-acetyltransferase